MCCKVVYIVYKTIPRSMNWNRHHITSTFLRASMTTLRVFLVLLIAASLTVGKRRPCDDDCDCRMSKGHRCVYRHGKNQLVHCSLRPGPGDGGCFCLRSCVTMDGTMIMKRKTISRPCSNCTCVTPRNNKATCVDNLQVECHPSMT